MAILGRPLALGVAAADIGVLRSISVALVAIGHRVAVVHHRGAVFWDFDAIPVSFNRAVCAGRAASALKGSTFHTRPPALRVDGKIDVSGAFEAAGVIGVVWVGERQVIDALVVVAAVRGESRVASCVAANGIAVSEDVHAGTGCSFRAVGPIPVGVTRNVGQLDGRHGGPARGLGRDSWGRVNRSLGRRLNGLLGRHDAPIIGDDPDVCAIPELLAGAHVREVDPLEDAVVARDTIRELEARLGDVVARQIAAAVAVGDGPAVDLPAAGIAVGCAVVATLVEMQALGVGRVVIVDAGVPLEDVLGEALLADAVAVGAEAEDDVSLVEGGGGGLNGDLLAGRVSLLDRGHAVVHDCRAHLPAK